MVSHNKKLSKLLLTSLSVNALITSFCVPVIAVADTVLEEVVVMARKKALNLQEAPIAVSVTTGEDIKRANLEKLDDFNGFVPGLTIAKNDGAGRVVSVRGVGWETAQNLGSQPSVLAYIDGIYLANPLAFGTDIGDIERVEVFRGPQGTEFGQDTTAGAINLVMKKPSMDALAAEVEVSLGTYNTTKTHAALNVPLNDTMAIRGSAQKYTRDGFAKIEGGDLDGYELDDADSVTGKLSFFWEPTDNLSLLLSAFHSDSDQHAAAQKNVDDPVADPRKLSQDYPGIFALKNSLYSAKVVWNTSAGVTINWLTGYQELEKKQTVDGDRLTEDLVSVNISGYANNNWDVLTFWDNNSKAFSQELNAIYSGDKLDWVAGAYYLDHENFNHFLEATGPSPFSDYIDALNNPSAVTLPPFASVLNFVEARTVTRKDSAVYGQLTYRASDKIALTAGIRYQKEKQTDEALQWFGALGPASLQKTSDSVVTWKLGVDVNLSEDNLLYGLISTGWKNGGSNPGAVISNAIQVPAEFEPAEVISYEIGSKNTVADGRGRLNLVAFYNDYDNLQFMQEDPVPFGGGTGNIPKTEIYGVETEFDWQLSDEWQLHGHLTWMDGKFTEDFYTLDTVDFREALTPFSIGLFTAAGAELRRLLGETTNLKGNTPPKLVKLSTRIGLTNIHTFSQRGQLTSRIDYVYRGSYQYRVFNNPLVDDVPSYNLVNLFFQYEPVDSHLKYSLTISNLFDKDGVNSRFTNPFGVYTTSEEYIPPRQAIATVKYEF